MGALWIIAVGVTGVVRYCANAEVFLAVAEPFAVAEGLAMPRRPVAPLMMLERSDIVCRAVWTVDKTPLIAEPELPVLASLVWSVPSDLLRDALMVEPGVWMVPGEPFLLVQGAAELLGVVGPHHELMPCPQPSWAR